MTRLQVISGGQDGVDIAVLRAAKRAELLICRWREGVEK